MRVESACKEMQTVREVNCCWQTVPHDWPGLSESSDAKQEQKEKEEQDE